MSATHPKPITKDWNWVFSNTDKVTLTITKEMVENNNNKIIFLEIHLVSYNEKQELNYPIHFKYDAYIDGQLRTETNIEYITIRYKVHNNKVTFLKEY
ncbi:MAG: hypothetical protein LBV51_04205 [Acholeplasmatales bacterium]|jgi:hypothetical protein|nr:hypothetical protein [Acholeplasmatales bacterium]